MSEVQAMRQRLWDVRNYIVGFVVFQDLAYHYALADPGFVELAVNRPAFAGFTTGHLTCAAVFAWTVALHACVLGVTRRGIELSKLASEARGEPETQARLEDGWRYLLGFQLAVIWFAGIHLIVSTILAIHT